MQNGKLNFENGGEEVFWKPIIDDEIFYIRFYSNKKNF